MIGTTVWIFDENNRVYRRDSKGQSIGGGPIWREHWRPVQIVSETKRSWVTAYRDKIPKKGHDPRLYAFTRNEIEEMAYVHENRYRLSREVQSLCDPKKMREIAAILDRVDA